MYGRMWSRMVDFLQHDPEVYSSNTDVLTKQVVNKNFVLYADKSVLTPLRENYSDLVITHPVALIQYGWLLQEGSYLKTPFDQKYVNAMTAVFGSPCYEWLTTSKLNIFWSLGQSARIGCVIHVCNIDTIMKSNKYINKEDSI